MVEEAGAQLLFLPPYHPDLNPIEPAWAKVKNVIRTIEPRGHEDLDKAIAAGACAVSQHDVAGWYRHSGYQVNRCA